MKRVHYTVLHEGRTYSATLESVFRGIGMVIIISISHSDGYVQLSPYPPGHIQAQIFLSEQQPFRTTGPGILTCRGGRKKQQIRRSEKPHSLKRMAKNEGGVRGLGLGSILLS